jgi:hypothetical protein
MRSKEGSLAAEAFRTPNAVALWRRLVGRLAFRENTGGGDRV